MKALRLLLSLFLLAVFAQVAQAQNKMNIQGQLNNADGTPTNGEFSVEFSIYNDSLGGTPLFTEAQRLAIAESFFQTSLDVRSILFDTQYWIGLRIDGGDELRPRLPLFSSPHSRSTRSLFGAENVVPSSGNVGFGTTDPKAPLHVVGDVRFEALDDSPPAGLDSFESILVIDMTGLVRRADPGPFLGINCWDLNGNGIKDPEEDTNGDGLHDALDCRGDAFNGMLNNIPLIIKDAQGVTQIQLNPDGTSTHSGLETFSGGIKSEGNFELDEADFRMILEEQFVGGIIVLPTTEPEDLEAQGKWRFEEAVHLLQGFVSEGDSQVNGTLMAEDIEAANELRAFHADVTEITTAVARVTQTLFVDGLADLQELLVQSNGQVKGNFMVDGTLNANNVSANVKNFRIDHPLDPAGQYLIHTSVESPDMMTVYNGNVVLDADGAATVEMPSYFEALNKDFRYQLTPIGGFAPVYVAEEIAGNRFKIGGGTPGMKVSWQVTGVRHDPYAEAYRSLVEVEKPTAEQGTYLHPELYGASPAQHARREGSDQR